MSISSANKLSLLLLSIFASSTATVAFKALLVSGVFLPFMSPAFFQSSFTCCCYAINIESYSFLEYFFNSIFPLKVPPLLLVFCCMAGLVWAMYATFTSSVVCNLLIYLVRKAITASKSLSYLSLYYSNFCEQLVTPYAI